MLAAWYVFLGMSGISHCLLNCYGVLHNVLIFKGLQCPGTDWHEGLLFTQRAREVAQLVSSCTKGRSAWVPALLSLLLQHTSRSWQFGFGLVLFFSEVSARLVGSQKNEI